METQYFRDFSPILGRDMECKIYGHAGRPVLYIPCQDGRFYDFENFHMTDAWAPWIESGQIMVCAIDTIDQETWSWTDGDPHSRICRHEQWIRYITEEMIPFFSTYCREKNDWDQNPGVVAFGCSLGAAHAANLFFRRPDLFDGVLALSGIYTTEYGFGTYMDELVYDNSPLHYLSNIPLDHPYIELYNQRQIIICAGQGPWEMPQSTYAMKDVLESKGIHAWVDLWGYDVAHDWDWWYRQVAYFVPFLVED